MCLSPGEEAISAEQQESVDMISKLAREFSVHIDRKLKHLETEARRAFTEQYKDTALE